MKFRAAGSDQTPYAKYEGRDYTRYDVDVDGVVAGAVQKGSPAGNWGLCKGWYAIKNGRADRRCYAKREDAAATLSK